MLLYSDPSIFFFPRTKTISVIIFTFAAVTHYFSFHSSLFHSSCFFVSLMFLSFFLFPPYQLPHHLPNFTLFTEQPNKHVLKHKPIAVHSSSRSFLLHHFTARGALSRLVLTWLLSSQTTATAITTLRITTIIIKY